MRARVNKNACALISLLLSFAQVSQELDAAAQFVAVYLLFPDAKDFLVFC
jgi:hypothetical protein